MKKLINKFFNREKKKAKKKMMKKVRNAILGCCAAVCLLGTGYFLGVHRKVLKAYIQGRPLPKAPKGHCCHR
ncbi:MAG: hypothetical protein IJQ02_09290 [Oscillospiraceae bacterium]|nr:hypothetical protein [Oscillospiraceae bacterium]